MVQFKAVREFAFGVALLTLILFGLLQVAFNRRLRKQTRGLLGGVFATQVLCVIANLQLQYADLTGEATEMVKISVFLQSLSVSGLLLFYTGFLFSELGIRLKGSRLFALACALETVYTALLIWTQFTDWIYYFTPAGDYRRGALYPLLLLPPALHLLLNLILLLLRRKALNPLKFKAHLAVTCVPLAAVLLQSVIDAGPLLVYSLASAFIFLFAVFFIEQARDSRRQQEELNRQRMNNLVLQMRPHFIYNTMMSIYYLCAQDPEKAQKVILDFYSYLQKNFSALGKEDLIPFTEELEHTRAYLAVEQMRFEDQLAVTYDTPCTAFRLPALTLQPIVENAVKHGIDPEHAALHIRITTAETAHGYEIRIENDGAAFAPQSDADIGEALNNIQERLKIACRGSLVITAQDHSTTVTITVPKQPRAD